jgi:endonuclease-3 related protein
MFADVFERLRAQHGSQEGWWPSESAFEVMVGALLVQRTTWRNAAAAIERLKDRQYLAAGPLARIETETLSILIRPAGFYRLKAARLKKLARFVVSAGGIDALRARPTDVLRDQLLELEGVGAYTRRLLTRLRHPLPAPSDAALKKEAEDALGFVQKLNEFHALVIAHGQRCCSPRPNCEPCRLKPVCGFEREWQSRLA